MSITVVTDVECDVCGNHSKTTVCSSVARAREARAHARFEGWVRRDGQDLCRECVKHFDGEADE